MCWTEQHDKRLIGEIALVDPFTGTKKGTVQRGKKWDEITENLCQLQYPLFKVEKRGVRDRYNLLSQRYRKKMKEEEKESGVSPELTEIEMGLQSIIEVEDAAEKETQSQSATKRDKFDQEKRSAEQIRKKAMEKLGETQKRKATTDDDEEWKKKKRRSTSNDSIHYLKEKNEQLAKYKEEELEMKKKELELETKKHDTMMQVFLKQQEQQQKQFQDFQAMMMTMLTKLTQK